MKKLCLILGLMVGSVLWAQPPRGFYNWWDSPVAKDLNLSEDQMKQIRTVVKEYRTKLIDTRASVEKAEAEIEDAFNDESLSQVRGNDAIERLVAARSEMTRTFSQMSLRLRAILTHEQWTELQKRRPRQMMGDIMMREMERRRSGERPARGEDRRKGAPPQQQQPPQQQPQQRQ
jgi:hypothetical protein